jgi:hypothetical protein
MRQNIKFGNADELLLARTSIHLREVKEPPTCKQKPVDDEDMEMVAYAFVFGFLIIGICVVLALA